AGIDPDIPCPKDKLPGLYNAFSDLLANIKSACFTPCIYYKDGEPEDFSSFALSHLAAYTCVPFKSASEMIETFYYERDIYGRIRSKSADLRHITDTALARESKKLDLQQRQMTDTEKRDKYRIYGDLLRTFSGSITSGSSEAKLSNYYDDGKEITIPLDPDLSVQDNANRYFERYAKLKRTYAALSEQIKVTEAAVEHLQSIKASLDTARTESDLSQIRQELSEYGYIKKTQSKKKEQIKSRPYHFVSSDGYDMYVGRNNYQNEEVTFSIADSNDWWFHVKGAPGSHVIVKCNGSELPDKTFEEAASLAAHFSSVTGGDKIEVDYTLRKNLKKPPAGWPGLVIYHTNYSLITGSDIKGLRQID
ncbi:MAG: NFACT family protein, partial [Lachnospiraceae bacterium]|nr:NFACT family protein [Candidatus Minthocola equi]